MDIQRFIRDKTRVLKAMLAAWAHSIRLLPHRTLSVRGSVGRKGVYALVSVYDHRKQEIPIDRPLTPEELESIWRIEDFNDPQRRIVKMFYDTGNAPVPRKNLVRHSSNVDQVNRILRKRGSPFRLRSLQVVDGVKLGTWEQEVCFRPVRIK